MEIISVIILFIFGNMNNQETQMTQYVPMANVEKRLLKRDKDFPKDAFCSPAYVEISDEGKIIKLYNEVPEGAVLVKKEISKESFKEWTLQAKEKWNKK